MTLLSDIKYSFVSRALPDDTFSVMMFEGSEGLSRCYDFRILLASEKSDIDLGSVLENTAVFTIHRDDGDVYFNGILKNFEQHHAYDKYYFYHADLTPRLWRLSQFVNNQVFLDMKLPDILTQVLKDGGLSESDFELRLQNDYKAWEYICQYRESHLDFISRWMERDGIYYFFEQSADKEKLILTDSKLSHQPRPHGDKITYALPSGLDGSHFQEVVQTFACTRQEVPKKVILKDYNYRTPSVGLTGEAKVSDQGNGEIYIYGEHFRTTDEGDHLAAIRAEEFLCREQEFVGDGMVPYIQPGYSFDLKGHYRSDYDAKYVVTEVHHEGNQTGYLNPGIRSAFGNEEIELSYYNLFRSIPADLQFRPPRETKKSRFRGMMNATIDAAGSGQYAELDDMGRYKVTLPFDLSGRKDGKASTWLRMMQPYAGSGQGMHFPLLKGTEVLLVFIDGDPDRPVIAGAVPNPEHQSPVTSENPTHCRLTTAGGNKIHIEDKQGEERILAHSPTSESFMRIGTVNDPDSDNMVIVDDPEDIKFSDPDREWAFLKREKDGITLATTQGFDLKAGTFNEIVLGEETSTTIGLAFSTNLIEKTVLHFLSDLDIFLGGKTDYKVGLHWQTIEAVTHMKWFHKKMSLAETLVEEETSELNGQVTNAIGDLDEAVGQANKARGDLSKATGNANRACSELNKAEGKASKAMGQLNKATGEANKACASLSSAVGEANDVTGDYNEALVEANEALGEGVSAWATVTNIIAARERASGVDSK
jgi:type VI secretion system secreted protein VgrG